MTSEYNTDEEEEATPRTPRSAAPLAAAAVAELVGAGDKEASGLTRQAVGAAEITDIFPGARPQQAQPAAAAAGPAPAAAEGPAPGPAAVSPPRPRKALQIATKPAAAKEEPSRRIDTGGRGARGRTGEGRQGAAGAQLGGEAGPGGWPWPGSPRRRPALGTDPSSSMVCLPSPLKRAPNGVFSEFSQRLQLLPNCSAAAAAVFEELLASATPAGAGETPRSAVETRFERLYVILISLHGLVRGERMELGKDSDTGGQVRGAAARQRGGSFLLRFSLFCCSISGPCWGAAGRYGGAGGDWLAGITA